MGKKVQQGALWTLLIIAAMIFLTLAATGRLGILLSIALVPDNVAYIGGQKTNG